MNEKFFALPVERQGQIINAAYNQGIDNMLMSMDTDSFRPGIDTRLLLEEINGYLLSCCRQMFSSGELAPDFLKKDILKRTGQWRMVYLKERND